MTASRLPRLATRRRREGREAAARTARESPDSGLARGSAPILWIESLFGHLKAESPHLKQIRDPAALHAELAQIQVRHNGVWPHAGIGYVTRRRAPGPQSGDSTGEIRPLRISPELARELLRVLREEDLELPEDSTVLAVIVEPHHARQPAPPQRPEDGIEGLIGILGDLDTPTDASERVDEYVYGHR